MNEVRKVFLCALAELKKWLGSPRVYIVLAFIIIFHWYTFAGMGQICSYLNRNVTPWVFPFFMQNPNLFFIFGGMAMLLYGDAPFLDSHMLFMMIRTGKRSWILGQLMFLLISSLIYTGCHAAASILMLFPHIDWSPEWGSVMWTMAQNPDVARAAGTQVSFYPVPELMEQMSPLFAFFLSLLLFWLGTVFLGMLLFGFRILFGKMSGIVACGFFTVLAYFAVYMGQIIWGRGILYVSPVSWCSLQYLSRSGNCDMPDVVYAVAVYGSCITVLMAVSVNVFCKKDSNENG